MVQTPQRAVSNRPAKLSDATVERLAACSTSAASAFALATSDGANVAMALAVADSIADLRELFDQPEVRTRIEALQDTPLGFRTDRDPKQKNHKTGELNTPYPWPVVRDANIEAVLRGLQVVGNQFNIIAGRFYGTKEGLEYLIPKVPGLSEFRQVLGVPRTQTGGAIVECKATWKMHGKPDSLEVSIPIKTDSYSGADQILGKATRKFLSRCYRQMCGANIPEGDIAEGGQLENHSATVERFTGPPATKTVTPEAPPKTHNQKPRDPRSELLAIAEAHGCSEGDMLEAFVYGESISQNDYEKMRSLADVPTQIIFDYLGADGAGERAIKELDKVKSKRPTEVAG